MSGHILAQEHVLHDLRAADGADGRDGRASRSSTSASLNFPVAIGIAITKATLVVLFFMHVKYSSRLTKLVVGMAFFFLLIHVRADDDRLPVARLVTPRPRGAAGAGTPAA